MMVLVAVGVGAGWLYCVGATLTGGGDVFYEAAAMLTTFVLLGHWFEMRARGGANDAIRALIDLAPPMATVLRDGGPVEVPTAEVVVDDLVLIRPGGKVPVDGTVVEGACGGRRVHGDRREPSGEQVGRVRASSAPRSTRTERSGYGPRRSVRIPRWPRSCSSSRRPRTRRRPASGSPTGPPSGSCSSPSSAVWRRSLVWLWSGADVETALLFAITVVVITCPDALGLATPTAIMVGTGLGAQRGVLFKSATALETAARIDTVVMDKTGTLTRASPRSPTSSSTG